MSDPGKADEPKMYPNAGYPLWRRVLAKLLGVTLPPKSGGK